MNQYKALFAVSVACLCVCVVTMPEDKVKMYASIKLMNLKWIQGETTTLLGVWGKESNLVSS